MASLTPKWRILPLPVVALVLLGLCLCAVGASDPLAELRGDLERLQLSSRRGDRRTDRNRDRREGSGENRSRSRSRSGSRSLSRGGSRDRDGSRGRSRSGSRDGGTRRGSRSGSRSGSRGGNVSRSSGGRGGGSGGGRRQRGGVRSRRPPSSSAGASSSSSSRPAERQNQPRNTQLNDDEDWAAQFATLNTLLQNSQNTLRDAQESTHLNQAVTLMRETDHYCRTTIPTAIRGIRAQYAEMGRDVPRYAEKRLGTLGALSKKMRTAIHELLPVANQMYDAMISVREGMRAQEAAPKVPETKKQRKKAEKRADAIAENASKITQLDAQLLNKMKKLQSQIGLYNGIVGSSD